MAIPDCNPIGNAQSIPLQLGQISDAHLEFFRVACEALRDVMAPKRNHAVVFLFPFLFHG